MYHAIVKRLVRKNFERVNQKDYEAVLFGCAPRIRHRFGGSHAMGGVRHDIAAFRRWLQRLGLVMPTLHLSIQDIWVKGWPQNTFVIVRWEASATLSDGSPYRNRGVHVIQLRWGKTFDIDAHENSQAVAAGLSVQFQHGISEAGAEPILS